MKTKWILIALEMGMMSACGDDTKEIIVDDDYWIKEYPALHNFDLDAAQ